MSSDGLTFLTWAAVADKDTWFSIHRRITFTDGRLPIFPGNAHQSIRTALEDANWWAQRGHCVYLAQGAFRNSGAPGKVYPSAIRQEPNLIACKNLYLDVDVKKGAYSTQKEAVAAIKAFLDKAGLPMPTIMVGSGNGGVHVYWTLDIEFDVGEFRRMAGQLIAAGDQHGLLFDRQCTRDAIRLLRVPGTWNFKFANDNVDATPVKLLYCAERNISLGEMQKALSQYKAVAGPGRTQESKSAGVNNDLSGGMKREYAPVNVDEAAKHCAFLRETLETGGAGYEEPLWKYSLALAARCEEPEATAHRLSKGHDEYDPATTEQKLAQGHGAGPPMCATIAMLAKQCATCPHLRLGTTPLAVGFKQPNGHAYAGEPPTQAQTR